MVDLNKYQTIIQDLLQEIHSYDISGSKNSIESQIILDTERNHYLLIDVGWEQKQFVYGTIIHLDIRGDKIWIQRNNTEIDLAKRLVEKGIPKENIVIGLHSPFMRRFSGYAMS
ncbi:XisI protein [Spirulina sp. 06S082]|uniref:XisI protein n=1 Tax=Spirulina sp. 06S082 TaxID=3110248 RepID=UPI002B21DC9D|nr:XisI protein [Spirulina sp. 06S082]MEA5467319.1 XisI protein [Spirulina sp. 06S082]